MFPCVCSIRWYRPASIYKLISYAVICDTRMCSSPDKYILGTVVICPFIKLMMMSSNGNIFGVAGPFEGKSPVAGEIPSQRAVTRSFDVFFDLRNNKCKQFIRW